MASRPSVGAVGFDTTSFIKSRLISSAHGLLMVLMLIYMPTLSVEWMMAHLVLAVGGVVVYVPFSFQQWSVIGEKQT